jgi:hypothetical protein
MLEFLLPQSERGRRVGTTESSVAAKEKLHYHFEESIAALIASTKERPGKGLRK